MATYITFGLSGAGKTYFANWFSKKFNVHFEDADHWLTDEMREYLRDDKVFTFDMLDRYFEVVSDHITALQHEHEHLIISQALYRESNRQQLLHSHPELTFILVSVEDSVLEKRLIARENGVSLEYARKNESYFERPNHHYLNIDNSVDNSDRHLFAQCLQYPEITPLKKSSAFNHLFKPALNSIKDFCTSRFRRQPAP